MQQFLQLVGPVFSENASKLPAQEPANPQFARTLMQLCDYSLTEKFRCVHFPQRGENVQLKYRLYRWRSGVFYWQENHSRKQGSLKTRDRHDAERLLHAMNESHRVPTLNLNIARRSRFENGATNLAGSHGRNGDAWNCVARCTG